MSQFDEYINTMLTEKFGTPGVVRKRSAAGAHMTSADPNAWKDPMKRYHMRANRGWNRKKIGWVSKTHQTETPLTMGERILNLAKAADQGIWEVSLAQAVPIAKKYKMHLPTVHKPTKRLGSTGIVMYFKYDKEQGRYRMYLIKHDRLIRSFVKRGKNKTYKAIKKGKKSRFKVKKTKKPMTPMFKKGNVEKFYTIA